MSRPSPRQCDFGHSLKDTRAHRSTREMSQPLVNSEKERLIEIKTEESSEMLPLALLANLPHHLLNT